MAGTALPNVLHPSATSLLSEAGGHSISNSLEPAAQTTVSSLFYFEISDRLELLLNVANIFLLASLLWDNLGSHLLC